MIQIQSVRIINYKSIKDYTFDFEKIDIDGSKSGILVGLNESGKSALLEAISLINAGFDEEDEYSELCNNEAQEKNEYIELYTKYLVTDSNELTKIGLTKVLDKSLIDKIKIKTIYQGQFLNNEEFDKSLTVELENTDIDLSGYYKCNITELVGTTSTQRLAILKELPAGQEEVKPTIKDLKIIIESAIKVNFFKIRPTVQFWKSSREYLINEEIDLTKFKEDAFISRPLKNIFNIYGKKTQAEIKSTLEKALKTPAKRDELVEKISESITKHINKIWKEHKIKIRVSINSDRCNVLVEDKDKNTIISQ